MDLSKGKEKVSELLNKFKEAFSNLSSLRASIALSLTDRFLSRFPEGKRRPILFGIGGIVVLFFILIITLAVNSGKPKTTTATDIIIGAVIPPEQLFIPAEPDFLPEFLLEREPRRFWTIEDIRHYWRNPGNPDFWREEIKSAVDKLMEGVR